MCLGRFGRRGLKSFGEVLLVPSLAESVLAVVGNLEETAQIEESLKLIQVGPRRVIAANDFEHPLQEIAPAGQAGRGREPSTDEENTPALRQILDQRSWWLDEHDAVHSYSPAFRVSRGFSADEDSIMPSMVTASGTRVNK